MAGFSTRAVHGTTTDADAGLALGLQRGTTFRYPEQASGEPAPYIYARYANPTVDAVEAGLAALEESQHALLVSSGMAALFTLCHAILRPGDTVAVQRGVYGGTIAMLEDDLQPFNVKIEVLDPVAKPALAKGTKLVLMESITNPMLRVADVQEWADAAHAAGALLAVDATFAGPTRQQPLKLGADMVMHSATKSLGGHSDLLGGVIATNDKELHEKLWLHRRNIGNIMDPETAWLLSRGMKTLDLRSRQQTANAAAVAKMAAEHPGVKAVHYPGLSGTNGHADNATARRVLRDFGGMITLDLGSKDAAVRFRRALRLATAAASLGGVETLVSLPLETSHAYASEESRRADGVGDGLVRISCGIEDTEDLIADLEQALGAA